MQGPFEGHQPQIEPEAFLHTAAVVVGEVPLGPLYSLWPTATLRGDDGPIRTDTRSSIQDGTVIHDTEGLLSTAVGDRVTVGHRVILHSCTVGNNCTCTAADHESIEFSWREYVKRVGQYRARGARDARAKD